MKNLSLAVVRMEAERNDLVSTLDQGSVGGQPFLRQEGQLGMLFKEQVGLQRMGIDQMQREMETAKEWGAMHRSVNHNLKKQVSISISNSARSLFTSSSRVGDVGHTFFYIQNLSSIA